MELPEHLRNTVKEIEGYALEYGLDPFETRFEMIEFDEMNEVASYGGFPTRYPHWRFGMEYEELEKGYAYGLQKIYELVINNDPCYAYLMKSNSDVDQKIVIAHVYGHSDFFKNNLWFSQTNRRMVDEMANHGMRIRRYMERYGQDVVEKFLDGCLSLENLTDYHSVYGPPKRRPSFDFDQAEVTANPKRFPAKEYLDRFVNPPSVLEKQRKKNEAAAARKKRLPEEPQRDVLLFLLDHAPLDNWQKDILSIAREEAYYFAPQGLTKIMNEGWASLWHSTIMTQKALGPSEVVDYADHHSGTLATRPGSLNPYKLGIELFRDIKDRYDKGKFGREYAECSDWKRKEKWDLKLGLGTQKIFEVRKVYHDLSFIDEFLTEEFCREQKLFVFKKNQQSNQYEISDREFKAVKAQLLQRLTNMGTPIISVVDGNFRNRSELLLKHHHEGYDIDIAEARDTLANLFRIWQRPVHIETLIEGETQLYSFDGENHNEESVKSP
jgi:stage V sporulation protein R